MKAVPRYRENRTNIKLHESIPSKDDHTPYLYFLIRNHKVVYIGQTHSLRSRLHTHNCFYNYDSVRWIKCRKRMLSHYEKRWIKKLQPEYNIMWTKNWGRNGKLFVERIA